MRRILLIIALTALTACAQKTLDFVFMDTVEGRQYHSTSLRADFDRYYPGLNINPFLILIEAPNMDVPVVQEQLAVFEHAEHGTAETLGIIYVVSSFSGGFESGYHTLTPEAQRLAGNLKGFRVRVLSPTGVVLKESDSVLAIDAIAKLIKQQQKSDNS